MQKILSTKRATNKKTIPNIAECCKNYNKMNKKIEQGANSENVVKITSIKLNKSIDFFAKLCYDKDSRDD